MNKNQKIALAIGVTLILLSGLFPPYEGELLIEGNYFRRHLGNHFIFTPPLPEYIRSVFDDEYVSWRILPSFHSKIVVSEIAIQLSVITLATVGIVLFLIKKEK